MPHLIIEYSSNVNSPAQLTQVTQAAHDAMIKSGLFAADDIKTRSYITQDFFIGNKAQNGAFVHAIIYLLEGRTTEQKQALSNAVLQVLKQHFNHVDQLTVDIRDMARATYQKHVNI